MKDAAHHLRHVQKKVIQSTRKEASQEKNSLKAKESVMSYAENRGAPLNGNASI